MSDSSEISWEDVLWQYSDLIIEVRTNIRKYPTWVRESDQMSKKLWAQIEKRIDKHGDEEAMIAMTFLLSCLGKTIRKCFPEERFLKIVDQIRDHLLKEITHDFK